MLQSFIVYLGEHSHGPEPTSADLDRVRTAHCQFLGSFLGRYRIFKIIRHCLWFLCCMIHNQVYFTLHSHEKAEDAIFYSYDKNINGFAAVMEEEEAAEIASEESTSCFHFSLFFPLFVTISISAFLPKTEHPNVISVFLNKGRKLHTTRSWEFLNLERNGVTRPHSIWKKARFGEDTIIANLDTGNSFFS